ncbi:TPA: GmrSD restriction endonuclease domain-containing protein, partial [Enterobacter asburiae]
SNLPFIGMIGNLIPLGSSINLKADTLPFTKKIVLYKDSNFRYTNNFYTLYKSEDSWTEQHIKDKTDELALLAYKTIWKI